MPRINVEESWLVDPRREVLADLLGDKDAADGVAIRFWRLAQEYDGGILPPNIFKAAKKSKEFLGADLAVEGPGGIYIRGAADRHEWLNKKREAGRLGGIASGKARSEGQQQTEANRSKCLDVLASAVAPEPSSSSSSSSSKEKKEMLISSTALFEELWKEYPTRNGRRIGKKDAMAAFNHLRSVDQAKCLPAIKAHKEVCQKGKARGEFVPEFQDLHRWLKKRRFDDELGIKNVTAVFVPKVKTAEEIEWEKRYMNEIA